MLWEHIEPFKIRRFSRWWFTERWAAEADRAACAKHKGLELPGVFGEQWQELQLEQSHRRV